MTPYKAIIRSLHASSQGHSYWLSFVYHPVDAEREPVCIEASPGNIRSLVSRAVYGEEKRPWGTLPLDVAQVYQTEESIGYRQWQRMAKGSLYESGEEAMVALRALLEGES